MNKKIYISGKITGISDYFSHFKFAENCLFHMGYRSILNPAYLPQGMSPADYMRICFSMIDSCDIVVLLDNWKGSKGAKLERDYALYIGKEVMELSEFTGRNKNE